jgi:hypothetical protein
MDADSLQAARIAAAETGASLGDILAAGLGLILARANRARTEGETAQCSDYHLGLIHLSHDGGLISPEVARERLAYAEKCRTIYGPRTIPAPVGFLETAGLSS